MFKEKAFAAAVIVSAVWHIFWLSAITVVSSPGHGARVKFSNVSFLGPILETAPVEVRATPAERSLLERRYLDIVGKAAARQKMPQAGRPGPEETTETDYYALKDGKLTELIRSAVGEERLEPAF